MATVIYGWADGIGACSWWRLQVPLTALAESGVPTRYGGAPNAQVLNQAHCIIGQRVVGRRESDLWQRLAQARKHRLIYDIDDDVFSIDPSNLAYHYYAKNRDRIIANVAVAEAVLVSTEPLAEVFSRHHKRVFVAPNCIPRWLLRHQRPRNERLTIGWAGSRAHRMDWDAHGAAIAEAITELPEADHHVMGYLFDYTEQIPASQLWHTDWRRSVPSYLKSADFDIALAPLAEHPFNESKSPVKVLELGALGIPSIASNVGPYKRYIRHGETGFLVDSPEDWRRYIHLLARDDYRREQMGAAAREQAAGHVIDDYLDAWMHGRP